MLKSVGVLPDEAVLRADGIEYTKRIHIMQYEMYTKFASYTLCHENNGNLFFYRHKKARSSIRQVGIEKLNLKECHDKPTISPAKCYGGEQ